MKSTNTMIRLKDEMKSRSNRKWKRISGRESDETSGVERKRAANSFATLSKSTARDPPGIWHGQPLLWALLGFVGGFIFLRKGWFIAGSTVIGWFFGRRKAKRQQEKRDAERQRRDFRRFLEALAPRLDAGSNIVEALRFAYTEVTQQDEMSLSHPLMQRIGQLLEAEQNGLSIKSGMKEIAAHNGDWMITSYFESMIIGMVQGADLGALSNAYLRILVEEERLKSDREARLDAARREQIILFTMPFLLLAVMQLTGLVSNEYRLLDYVMRLVFAVLYGAAWIWSRRILETSGLATRGEK